MAILDGIFRQDFRLSRGNASLLRGADNVRSALQNRFAVFPLSVPYRPVYGSSLKRYSNEPLTLELENQIVKEIRTQVERDPRVKSVRKISITSTAEGELRAEVEIVLLGNADNFQFEVVI